MKKLALILIASVISFYSYSQTDSSLKHARELIEVTGAAKVAGQVMNNMISSYKKQLPNVTADFWDETIKEINVIDLADIVAPIYSKYYTDEELTKLIEFYKSPLGRKVVEKLPMITQDSYAAGEEWGKKISERVVARLKEKGYTKSL